MADRLRRRAIRNMRTTTHQLLVRHGTQPQWRPPSTAHLHQQTRRTDRRQHAQKIPHTSHHQAPNLLRRRMHGSRQLQRGTAKRRIHQTLAPGNDRIPTPPTRLPLRNSRANCIQQDSHILEQIQTRRKVTVVLRDNRQTTLPSRQLEDGQRSLQHGKNSSNLLNLINSPGLSRCKGFTSRSSHTQKTCE